MARFAPRYPATAARWLATSLGLGAALLVLMTFRHGMTRVESVVTDVLAVSMTALTVAVVVAVGRGWCPGPRSWVGTVVGTTALITLSNLLTGDVSVPAQMFFLLPPLVAASQLPPFAGRVFAALSCAGHLLVVLMLLPLDVAVLAWVNVSVLAGLVVHLLSRAGRRTDALVAELRRHAATDPLTGLTTRRVLDDAAESALAASASTDGVALVIVDLDHFKTVNDVHGHPAGDAALVHLGELLVRGAGPGAVVSRLGGDEFALLLPGCSLDEASALAEACAELVRRTPVPLPGGQQLEFTVSVGVGHSSLCAPVAAGPAGDGEDTGGLAPALLYRSADEALYQAKRGGRDAVAVAGRPLDPRAPARCGGGSRTGQRTEATR